MSNLIEVSHLTIPLSGGGKPKQSFGWEVEVEPFKQDAVFWHRISTSGGRPSTGVVRDVMAKTENRYHLQSGGVKR